MRPLALFLFLIATQVMPGGNATARTPGSIELGLDAGVSVLTTGHATDVAIAFPIQNLRLGVFVTERLQFEPWLGFTLTSVDRRDVDAPAETDHTWGLGLAGTYHFTAVESGPCPFFRAGPMVVVESFGDTRTQFGVEGGFGVKVPSSRQWGWRVELGLAKLFESDEAGAWTATLGIGFSFFTR